AVKEPFTWSPGWISPSYCAPLIVLSLPPSRNYTRDQMARRLEQNYGTPDVIAGVATGAIGIGMLVAEYMSLPFVYVRPEPTKHGRGNQIEGFLDRGQNVVVVEDLISTGMSSLNAVKALKEHGAAVKGMIGIFSYGFDLAGENFKAQNTNLITLSSYDYLLQQALETKYISDTELIALQQWRTSPENWK